MKRITISEAKYLKSQGERDYDVHVTYVVRDNWSYIRMHDSEFAEYLPALHYLQEAARHVYSGFDLSIENWGKAVAA